MALKRLRQIQRRKALGYTQEALVEQVGCERSTASSLCATRRGFRLPCGGRG